MQSLLQAPEVINNVVEQCQEYLMIVIIINLSLSLL